MLLVVPLLLKVCSMAALEDRTLWVLKNSMGKKGMSSNLWISAGFLYSRSQKERYSELFSN